MNRFFIAIVSALVVLVPSGALADSVGDTEREGVAHLLNASMSVV